MNSPTTIRGRKMTKTMKRRGTIGVVSGALLVGALAMSPAQAEGPSFEVTSSKPTVGIGDQVTITVAAENVQDVYAYRFALDYDETRLAYVPDSASTDITGSTYASLSGGDLSVLHTKLGTSPAASGDITLVSATFTALKPGSAAVSVPSLELVGPGGDSVEVDDVDAGSVMVSDQPAAQAVVRPAISGTRQVGRTLAVSTGTWSVDGVSTSVQWLRGGTPITGATNATYRVKPADFGALISARVTASAADRADGVATAKAMKIVRKAASRTAVRAPGKVKAGRVWKARVSVTAPGVSPRGKLRVIHRGKVLRTVKVVDGDATVAVRLGNKRGRTSVRFVYVPQSGVKASARTIKVRMR